MKLEDVIKSSDEILRGLENIDYDILTTEKVENLLYKLYQIYQNYNEVKEKLEKEGKNDRVEMEAERQLIFDIIEKKKKEVQAYILKLQEIYKKLTGKNFNIETYSVTPNFSNLIKYTDLDGDRLISNNEVEKITNIVNKFNKLKKDFPDLYLRLKEKYKERIKKQDKIENIFFLLNKLELYKKVEPILKIKDKKLLNIILKGFGIEYKEDNINTFLNNEDKFVKLSYEKLLILDFVKEIDKIKDKKTKNIFLEILSNNFSVIYKTFINNKKIIDDLIDYNFYFPINTNITFSKKDLNNINETIPLLKNDIFNKEEIFEIIKKENLYNKSIYEKKEILKEYYRNKKEKERKNKIIRNFLNNLKNYKSIIIDLNKLNTLINKEIDNTDLKNIEEFNILFDDFEKIKSKERLVIIEIDKFNLDKLDKIFSYINSYLKELYYAYNDIDDYSMANDFLENIIKPTIKIKEFNDYVKIEERIEKIKKIRNKIKTYPTKIKKYYKKGNDGNDFWNGLFTGYIINDILNSSSTHDSGSDDNYNSDWFGNNDDSNDDSDNGWSSDGGVGWGSDSNNDWSSDSSSDWSDDSGSSWSSDGGVGW